MARPPRPPEHGWDSPLWPGPSDEYKLCSLPWVPALSTRAQAVLYPGTSDHQESHHDYLFLSTTCQGSLWLPSQPPQGQIPANNTSWTPAQCLTLDTRPEVKETDVVTVPKEFPSRWGGDGGRTPIVK